MIYLSPLMLIGSALVLQSRRIDWRIVAAATALVLFLDLREADAAGLPVLRGAGVRDPHDPEPALGLGRRTTCGSRSSSCSRSWLLVLLAFRRCRGRGRGRGVVLCCAWMLTSEISRTRGFTDFADKFRSSLPAQLDWVDRDTGGQPVTYLGQADHAGPERAPADRVLEPLAAARLQPRRHGARAPARPARPSIVSKDGRLSRMPGRQPVRARRQRRQRCRRRPSTTWGQLTPLPQGRPVEAARRRAAGLRPTAGRRDWSTYTYFRPGQHGTLDVTLSRTAYNGGDAKPGHARVEVSTVRIDPDAGRPGAGARVLASSARSIENGKQVTLRFPVAQTPVRVEVYITPTFHAERERPAQPRRAGRLQVPSRRSRGSRARTRCRARAAPRARAGRCARAPSSAARTGPGTANCCGRKNGRSSSSPKPLCAQVALELRRGRRCAGRSRRRTSCACSPATRRKNARRSAA